MALTFPLSLPSVGLRTILFRARSVVGLSESPFTLEQQLYEHQGEGWGADVTLPKMRRPDAEPWVAFLLGLRGIAGTFLMGDPVNTSPRGTWAGAPKVLGAHAARVATIAMDGFSAAATVKAGDWFQTGSGSLTHLHKVVQDATADGAGLLTLEIWPRTRAALADNDTFVTSSPKGLWRLTTNEREWSLELAQLYGIRFSCVEAQ